MASTSTRKAAVNTRQQFSAIFAFLAMSTPNKDTFHTFAYRGGYIHTCQNRDTKREEAKVSLPDGTTRPARSVHAAKIAITKASK